MNRVVAGVLVQLVSDVGLTIGTADKLDVHRPPGKLHRAISVLLFRDQELLIQQRADNKYHFPARWANSCCSHPSPQETPLQAAQRAMREELGTETLLEEQFSFVYAAEDPASTLWEREWDHVFTGALEQAPNPNADHVRAIRLITAPQLADEMKSAPDSFAPWLAELLIQAAKSQGILGKFAQAWQSARPPG